MNTDAPLNEKSPKKTGSWFFIFPVIFAILLIAGIGLFVSKKGIMPEEMVQAALSGWQAQFNAPDKGRTLSFDSFELMGGASDPHVLVHNPKIRAERVNDEGEKEVMSVMTPKLSLYPQDFSLSAFRIELTDPLLVSNEEEDVLRVTFGAPLNVHYRQKKEPGDSGAIRLHEYDISTPAQTMFDMLDTGEQLLMEMGDGSKALLTLGDAPQSRGDLDLQLQSLRLVPQEQGAAPLTIASLTTVTQWRDLHQPRGAFATQTTITDLFTTQEDMPYGGLSATLDLDYSGPISDGTRTIDWTTEQALVHLKQFDVTAQDVQLTSHLQFQTGTGEVLPIGAGLIEIKNFAFVREELDKFGLVEGDNKLLLDALFKQALGQPYDEVTDLSLPIKREDDAELKIGEANFGDLFVIFLTGGKLDNVPAEPAPDAAPENPAPELTEEEIGELFNE